MVVVEVVVATSSNAGLGTDDTGIRSDGELMSGRMEASGIIHILS